MWRPLFRGPFWGEAVRVRVLPIGSMVVPFFVALCLETYKAPPKKEVQWSLWVSASGQRVTSLRGSGAQGLSVLLDPCPNLSSFSGEFGEVMWGFVLRESGA